MDVDTRLSGLVHIHMQQKHIPACVCFGSFEAVSLVMHRAVHSLEWAALHTTISPEKLQNMFESEAWWITTVFGVFAALGMPHF